MESLSAYARQFLDLMSKPDVDSIEGLSPAISIEQKTTSKNPRSTVGTITEIYDYMRLLWARVGVPYSPATGLPIESQTVSQMVDAVMAYPEGSKLLILAPVVRGRKGEYRKEMAEWQKRGFNAFKLMAFYMNWVKHLLWIKIKNTILPLWWIGLWCGRIWKAGWRNPLKSVGFGRWFNAGSKRFG